MFTVDKNSYTLPDLSKK